MITNLTMEPFEILVTLINETNGIKLTTSDVTFSPPSINLGGSRNTGLTLTATHVSAYLGVQDVTYDRLDLAALPGERSVGFFKGTSTVAQDLIQALNTAYKINLRPEDYHNDPLPDFEPDARGVQKSFVLRTKPGSYIYYGSLELAIFSANDNLTDLLNVDALNGFTFLKTDPTPLFNVERLDGLTYT